METTTEINPARHWREGLGRSATGKLIRNAAAGALAACLLALLTLAPAAKAAGEFELNDDRTSAYGPLEGGVDYTATFETDNDVDWYLFYIGQYGQVEFSTSTVDSQCTSIFDELTLELRDKDGRQLEENPFLRLPIFSEDEGKVYHVHLTLDAGRYYLRGEDSDGCAGSRYLFRIDPADALTDTEPEPDPPPDNDSQPPVDQPTIIPKPTLTAGPNGRTSKRHASFRFHSNYEGGRLQCKLTGKRVPKKLKHWRRCESLKHYTGLTLGKKVFWVRELKDGKSSKPVRRRWFVAKKPMNAFADARRAILPVTCSLRRKPCMARVAIKAGKRTFARGRYVIPARKKRWVRLRLTKAGRKRLSHSKRARAKVVFTDLRSRKRKTVPVILRSKG